MESLDTIYSGSGCKVSLNMLNWSRSPPPCDRVKKLRKKASDRLRCTVCRKSASKKCWAWSVGYSYRFSGMMVYMTSTNLPDTDQILYLYFYTDVYIQSSKSRLSNLRWRRIRWTLKSENVFARVWKGEGRFTRRSQYSRWVCANTIDSSQEKKKHLNKSFNQSYAKWIFSWK